MGSTSDRLPSFKGPRDLSLSARGAKRDAPGTSQGSSQARPRRVFTPNIPPKRDRGGTASSAGGHPTTSTHKESTNEQGSSRGRSSRGRGGPRGGARPVKQRGELVQSESIFSDGVGDPMEAKRNSSMQYRTGYGGRYKSATEGGPSRISSMNRTTLNTLIKEEHDESSKKIFGNERFEQEEDLDISVDNSNVPVVLPLIGYVPELFMEPTVLQTEASDCLPAVQPKQEPLEEPIPGPSLDSSPASMIKIKKEKIDDDDDPASAILKIKKEKLDDTDTDKTLEIDREALAALSLDATTFAGTFRSTPPDGTLVYFQFPDELPVLEGSVRESVDHQDTDKNPADLVQDIGDLPEGFIGRLQILSSGRTRFVIGENNFDVDSGRPVGFRQELLSVDIEKKTLTNLGTINKKFILTPDIECLISDSL